MLNKRNAILFLGDVVPYKPFKFRNTNNTVINLECPIIKEGNPVDGKINLSVKKNYLTEIFGKNSIIACLGNNHILDYGAEGLNSTIVELGKENIKWFGFNRESDTRYSPLICEINSNKIAFISAICRSTSPLVELDSITYLSLLDVDAIVDRVAQIRKMADRIVLYIHWGEEESSYPKKEDVLSARMLIDAGVDVIIGSHAHAPQPIEKYNNGIIAYNLGNFIMPALKKVPSYFDEGGIPHSVFNKHLMLWNRVSWGLLIDMETLKYKVKKYMFIFNRIIELPFTPLDKYIILDKDIFNDSYELFINKHLKKRELFRKLCDFVYKPHVPQIVRKILWK